MKFRDLEIKKILIVTLSNLGDVILTFPVIDTLIENFPAAEISLVVGPRSKILFDGNPRFKDIYIFNKKVSGFKHLAWVMKLRQQTFDLVVDLRQSAIPFMIKARHKTPARAVKTNVHMRLNHLNRLKTVFDIPSDKAASRSSLYIADADKTYIEGLLKGSLHENFSLIAVAPGAANHIKRWKAEGFAQVCDRLLEKKKTTVIFVGDANDKLTTAKIKEHMKLKALDFCGQTTFGQLAYLLQKCAFVLVNDSAVMHLASYLDIPTVAIFGPTNPNKYGPWSSRSRIVRKDLFCSPCEKSGCAYHHECMQQIESQEILHAIKELHDETKF